jgi:alkylhydroperoxidase/carboxymuconolactone decarboxylase family protein YurZ
MMPGGPFGAEIGCIAVTSYEKTLCRVAIADDAYVEEMLSSDRANLTASTLDAKAHALVRLGALIAIDAETPAYMWTLESARRAGASNDEIVGCLLAVMPTLGVARVISAAPKLGLALGFDVTTALEALS